MITKSLIKPNKNLNSVRVCVEAITLLSTHADIFKEQLKKESSEIINTALEIGAKQSNQDIREAAGELLAQVAAQVADIEDEDEESKEIAKDIINLLTQVWNDENEHSVKIEPTVKAVGILSKGIKVLMGEDTLRTYLEKLMFVEMNTYRIVEEFGDLSDPDKEVKRFKVILKKQKQLISFLSSYAAFISNMSLPPGERECQHFYDLALTATKNFRKLYVKWRPKFLSALATLIMSLHEHQAMFKHWIVKFVKQAVGDIITSHAGVTQAELEESLDDAVHFWAGLIEETKELSEPTCVQIYDTLLNTVIGYISSVIDGDQVVIEGEVKQDKFIARLTDFLILLLPNCQSQWFARWYPNYVLLMQRLISNSQNEKLFHLMVIPILTVEISEIKSKQNSAIFEVVYKWIVKSAVPQLHKYKHGFVSIGTEDRNKHILLDFIDKIGHIVKSEVVNHKNDKFRSKALQREAEKARTDIFNFLFEFLISNKEVNGNKVISEETQEPGIRKGRAIALRKLQAAKEKFEANKNRQEHKEIEEIDIRILSLLGRLGGINHQYVKDERKADQKQEVVFLPSNIQFANKSSNFLLNFNIQGFGVQIELQSILSRIVDVAENDMESDDKIEAWNILNSLTFHIKDMDDTQSELVLEPDLSPYQNLCIEYVKWFARSVPFESNETKNMFEKLQKSAIANTKIMPIELATRWICEYVKAVLTHKNINIDGQKVNLKTRVAHCKAVLRNVQSDSSHPEAWRRFVSIHLIKSILEVVKPNFELYEFIMAEIVPMCFQNLNQLIVATKKNFDQSSGSKYATSEGVDYKLMTKPAHELLNLCDMVEETLPDFTEQFKKQINAPGIGEVETNLNIEEQDPSAHPTVIHLSNFWEYLLTHSFCSDHHWRHYNQRILYVLATGFFTPLNTIQLLDEWIINLINTWNLAVNKQIEQPQLDLLESGSDQEVLKHLTAQLQGINWLKTSMGVDLSKIVNQELHFNIVHAIKAIYQPNMENHILDQNRKVLNGLYFKQLFKLLANCSETEEIYTEFVQHLEIQAEFDSYAVAIQTLLIPESLGLALSADDEDTLMEEIMQNAAEYILVCTKKHGKRILRGIKTVKDDYPQIDLTSIDPEIPEEYSSKITQGYLKLMEIEKSTEKREVYQLLSEKWNAHLIGCTELWVGNDSSPVINLKGKHLLNFLCQVYIPSDKLCSWLTDKNSDFHKANESLWKYIAGNTEIIEYLLARTPDTPNLMTLWLPIINTLMQIAKDKQEVLKSFIRYIPREWKDPLENDDRKGDQLRAYCILAHHCVKYNLFDEEVFPESQEMLIHFLNQINEYTHDSHPVFVKYDCLSLAGIIYNLPSPLKVKNGAKSTKSTQICGEVLHSAINRILNRYFPLWSHEIKPDTREKRYYEMTFDGIINLITFSKNPKALKLLFRVIKEDKTLFEHKLEHALHVLITKGFNKLSLAEFLVHAKILFAEFIDFDSEDPALGNQSIHNNLKFGIVDRCILKLFKTCPFDYLTPIINDLAPKLAKRLQEDLDTKDMDTSMYQLKERGYILLIFEVWTSRISQSSTSVKDFYNSIKVKGTELTKVLIKVCQYQNLLKIPEISEGKLEREEDAADWAQLVDFYTRGCWSCINSVISHTQSKETIFENFLFTSKDGQKTIWDLLVPETTVYKFSVETDFKIKDSKYENKIWEDSQGEDIIIQRFNDNFFTNDNLLMGAQLTSQVDENPKHLKRKNDKVRQLIDEEMEKEEEDAEMESDKPEEEDDYELDELNKHPCMQNILETLDTLKSQFSSTWTEEKMPGWMEKLQKDYVNSNPSARLFILKLMVNRPDIFQPYAVCQNSKLEENAQKTWFAILAEYAISKENGGKGLHYFLRDICLLLINFSEKVDLKNDQNIQY